MVARVSEKNKMCRSSAQGSASVANVVSQGLGKMVLRGLLHARSYFLVIV